MTGFPVTTFSDVQTAVNRLLSRWHYPVALALGALNTLSFAPTPHGGWLGIAIIALLYFWLTRMNGWKAALFTGWAFGFGNFVTGVWWLYVSMHFYGDLPAPLALTALALLALCLGFFPACAAALWSYCTGSADSRRGAFSAWHGALIFASVWSLCEWLRGTLFTGFPWLASGYAQVDGPLAGFAPLVGVYGIGWVLALAAALIVQAVYALVGRHPLRAASLACFTVAFIAAGLLLPRISWTTPAGAPVSVRLLQDNVKQDMKFDPATILAELHELGRLITEKPAALVVTPETAVPILLQQAPQSFTAALQKFADTTGTSILFGAVGGTITPDGQITDYTNSLFGITPNGRNVYRYDKHHLVPFGEFVPWGFHWFVQLMNIPLGDFARGNAVQPPFSVRGQRIAVNICYEDLFGEEIAHNLSGNDEPPTILINASNLGWFGHTIALEQHLQIARMRTLETGRPMLAATNTGITAAIDAHGNVSAQLRPFTTGSLDVSVQGMTGLTPYVRSGNTPVLALALLLLASGLASRFFTRPKKAPIR